MFTANQPVAEMSDRNRSDISILGNQTTENLLKQLEYARKEIECLKEKLRALEQHTQKRSYSPRTWEEEEEIVERETDWILKESRNKKRKATESPETSFNIPKAKPETNKNRKPPPIVLSNVQNYGEIKQKLQMDKFKCSTSMMSNKQIKVNVSNGEEYREITKIIKDTDLEWHTYENKAERPIRVMVRHLHPSTDAKDVLEELRERGYKITNADQKLRKQKGTEETNYLRLPLYMLTFEAKEDIKKIYNIQYINSMKVKIEAIKTNKLIAQCKKCQRYGHTQKFCKRLATCVKCAGNHLTVECRKPKTTPAKCVNCNEAHPANYRGCTVAKVLQKRRDDTIKNRKLSSQPKIHTTNVRKEGVSYAQIVENRRENTTPAQTPEPSMAQMMQTMMNMLDQVNQRLDNLEAKSTGAIPKRK